MGFLKRLFHKEPVFQEEIEDCEWDKVQNTRNIINMNDDAERESYVRSCLEQMQVASSEIDKLDNEYANVTSYLTDIEEIEALPDEDKKGIEEIANHIKQLRFERDAYIRKTSRMTDEEYLVMERLEDEVEAGITKLRQEEDYRDKVKRDLGRIDKERHAYDYRKRELSGAVNNTRGMSGICIIAAGVLTILLLIMQFLLDMDVKIGYYLTAAALAIGLTIIYLKYMDFVNEKRKIENTINDLILLQNKVKIRYVNNQNLLDYLYMKYDVDSSAKLKEIYDKFLLEKEDRRKFTRNEAIYSDELERLVKTLRKYRVKDPDIWMHQSDALIDNREMVEIRHKLIGRRQKLRKQMEYNQDIAGEASDEIKSILAEYPQYAKSLLLIVDEFEAKQH